MNNMLDAIRRDISSKVSEDREFSSQYSMLAFYIRLGVYALVYIGDCIRSK